MGNTKLTMNAIITSLSLSNDYCFAYVFTNELRNDNERSNEVSILAKRKNCNMHFLISNRASTHQQIEIKTKVIEQIALETRDFLLNFDDEHEKIGPWLFRANSFLIKSFEITLNTPIHFKHLFNIFNTNLTHPDFYPIYTEPIK
ncbi:unnamed protein product [Rotaria sp. Silwood1]|nr:unnamed protein product [Rotaria sp. Silwood1]